MGKHGFRHLLFVGSLSLCLGTCVARPLPAQAFASIEAPAPPLSGLGNSPGNSPVNPPIFAHSAAPSPLVASSLLPMGGAPFLSFGQTSSTKTARSALTKLRRTSIRPSMVGYIDDAGIRSEIRIRLDVAVHDDTPDRAEFFYAKCGCYRGVPAGTGPDPSSPGPGPGIPQYVNFQQLYLLGEYAPLKHVSLFTELPIRWLQPHVQPGNTPPFANQAGVSDLRLGVKFAPFAGENHVLTLQIKASLPTGDAFNGLGSNHASIEPAILYFQRVSPRVFVEAEFGDTHPISSSGSAGVPGATGTQGFAGDVLFYGIGPSISLINRDSFRLAPVLELVGWNVRSGFVTGRASTGGTNIVNLKVGPRIYVGAHSSFYAGYGIALTSQTWYREIFRTEYRYSF